MQRAIDRDRGSNALCLKLPPLRIQNVAASAPQSADSNPRSQTIPIAPPPCIFSRAFVQSGFNEVAQLRLPRPPVSATSQNPPDSLEGRMLIPSV